MDRLIGEIIDNAASIRGFFIVVIDEVVIFPYKELN